MFYTKYYFVFDYELQSKKYISKNNEEKNCFSENLLYILITVLLTSAKLSFKNFV